MLGHLEAMKDGYCFTLWTRQIMLEARLVSGLELGSPSATLFGLAQFGPIVTR